MKFTGKQTLVRHATDVDVSVQGNDIILRANEYSAKLSSRHAIARAVKATSPQVVVDNLRGGHFVFEGNKLLDHRPPSYTGFMHSDDAIAYLNESVGNFSLKSQFDIAKYGDGGKFDFEVGYTFNPFNPNVQSNVQLMRLICENGMVGRSEFFVRQIPVINHHHRHMEIAGEMLAKEASEKIILSLEKSEYTMASVAEVMNAHTHVKERLNEAPLHQKERLERMLQGTDAINFSDRYTTMALTTAAIREQIPSHLNRFTLYNLLTELRSHTSETDRSTNNRLDMMASDLLLNESKIKERQQIIMPPTFTSPEEAFVFA